MGAFFVQRIRDARALTAGLSVLGMLGTLPTAHATPATREACRMSLGIRLVLKINSAAGFSASSFCSAIFASSSAGKPRNFWSAKKETKRP